MTTERPDAAATDADDDVRARRDRGAGGVAPSPDGPVVPTTRAAAVGSASRVAPVAPRARRGHRGLTAAAGAVVGLLLVAGAVLLGTTDPSSNVVADAPAVPSSLDPTGAPQGTVVPAVWPAATAEAVQTLAATDRALLDPVATAHAYLADRLGGDGGDRRLEVAAFRAGAPQSGSVPYTAGEETAGEVVVRRLGGEGSPWYVAAATSARLTYDEDVQDGEVVLRITTEAAGTLNHEVTGPDGEVLLGGSVPAEPSGTVTLGRLDREGPVTVRARLESEEGALLGHLELWAEPNPPPAGGPG